jgi:hypothetical protein
MKANKGRKTKVKRQTARELRGGKKGSVWERNLPFSAVWKWRNEIKTKFAQHMNIDNVVIQLLSWENEFRKAFSHDVVFPLPSRVPRKRIHVD